MLPSTSAWSTGYGSNFPASSSLSSFGEKGHRMSTNQPSTTDFWGGHQHRHRPPPPQETRFALGYQQSDVPWSSPSSSTVSSTGRRPPATGLAIKDELTDPSDYSSSEDTCSDYRGAANSDYRGGGDPEDRCRRTAKGRKTDSDETMTAEEIEKRRQRRERNKTAAARCRQRRVDLTNQLLAETELLEDERDRLQREIQALQHERWQLEDLLGSHTARCQGRSTTTTTTTTASDHMIDVPPIKTERCDNEYYYNMADNAGCLHPYQQNNHRAPSYGSYAPPSPLTTKPSSFPPSCSRRPDSLPLTRRPAAAAAALGGQTMANLDLHCMLDGHTGLTPITGAAPGSVPDQMVSSPVDCGGGYSPTTLMTL